MDIGYEALMWVSKAMVVISFTLLCLFVIAQFYYMLFDVVEDENLKDSIFETLDIVNKESKWG